MLAAISPALSRLAADCLSPDPTARPSAALVSKRMQREVLHEMETGLRPPETARVARQISSHLLGSVTGQHAGGEGHGGVKGLRRSVLMLHAARSSFMSLGQGNSMTGASASVSGAVPPALLDSMPSQGDGSRAHTHTSDASLGRLSIASVVSARHGKRASRKKMIIAGDDLLFEVRGGWSCWNYGISVRGRC